MYVHVCTFGICEAWACIEAERTCVSNISNIHVCVREGGRERRLAMHTRVEVILVIYDMIVIMIIRMIMHTCICMPMLMIAMMMMIMIIIAIMIMIVIKIMIMIVIMLHGDG